MDLSQIKTPYAISIVGFHPEKVINPFLSQAIKVKSIILLHSDHPQAIETKEKVTKILEENVGVIVCPLQLNDIFNFYEILMVAESLRAALGNPAWINTTAGPGLGASALTLMASYHDIDIVAYDKENNGTRTIPLSRLKDLYKCRDKYAPYLKAIESAGNISLKDLASRLNISISTASRHIKMFKQLELIKISGSGRGSIPYIVSLTSWGKRFLSASEIYLKSINEEDRM
ncbi:MAG TPA: winged helix-turn-helix transcriptional regulator [Methanomassiliicoccaceae archaeon]|jgi:DNA-binding MarR family transcriptional regulator|nr:winged helix-turn-helix transcriptional regulator [Methanomassiliicoccaceae archaeon]